MDAFNFEYHDAFNELSKEYNRRIWGMPANSLVEFLRGTSYKTVTVNKVNYAAVMDALCDTEFSATEVSKSEFVMPGYFMYDGTRYKLNKLFALLAQ